VINAITRLRLKLLASSRIPAHWFYQQPPERALRASRHGQLHIEIVSHCWQYSRLLAYQLSSLIQHPVHDARITMTVYHARSDEATHQLLNFVGQQAVPNVTWNWQELPPEHLFRRAIGRNLAARQSTADWVWFTDCDLTFQHNCLNSLNDVLQGRQDALVYPNVESKTDVYTEDDLVTNNSLQEPELLFVQPSQFIAHNITRATGPLQITHGDVARAIGYCNDVPFYQTPSNHWEKAVEDRMFRWLIGSQGVGVDVDGVCRIQHAEKGRYRNDSAMSAWRRRIRQVQHMLRN